MAQSPAAAALAQPASLRPSTLIPPAHSAALAHLPAVIAESQPTSQADMHGPAFFIVSLASGKGVSHSSVEALAYIWGSSSLQTPSVVPALMQVGRTPSPCNMP